MAKKPNKLYLEDVVKLIRNLESGLYKKGEGVLVSDDGTKFCCLGVWADQHGCVWHPNDDRELIPSLSNSKVSAKQGTAKLVPELSFGLETDDQNKLAHLNDGNNDWENVILYLKEEILPKAV